MDFLFDINRTTLHMPTIRFFDVLEIFIIAFLVYHILVWAKDTRLWSLLKGVIVIVVFILIAAIFNMSTIFSIQDLPLYLATTATNSA